MTENPTAPSPPVLDQLSDQAVDEEYRRRFMRSQSSMTRPFSQDEFYQRALSSDPPVRSDSTGSTPSYYTPSIPRMQAAGGGDGGGGGKDDDGDEHRGPPSGGPGRGFNPPGPGGPSGPPMPPYPFMAPTRMNVIAHEHAEFRLSSVSALSLGTFSSNCLNAFVLEPGFNPVDRISPSLQDQMVLQENRNLL